MQSQYYMNNILTITLFFIVNLFILNSSGQGWTKQKPYPTYNHLYAVEFPTEDIGYIGGDNGTLMKTIDGGITWNQVNIPDYIEHVNNLTFISEDTGFFANASHMFKTTDGGQSWNATLLNYLSGIDAVYFLNDTIGFAYGQYNTVYKTTDCGESWTRITSNDFIDCKYQCLRFANQDTGFLINHLYTPEWTYKLMRSADGGVVWEEMDIPDEVTDLSSLSVLGSNDIWIASKSPYYNSNYWTGKEARVYHTVDGGATWTAHAIGMANSSNAIETIEFFNEMEGRVIGFGHIWTTSDGGQTWIDHLNYDIKSYGEHANSWINLNTCFIVNDLPSILKTTDNGSNFEQLTHETDYNYNCVFFIDTLNGIVAGHEQGYGNTNAIIRYTSDGGNTWIDAEIDSTALSVFDIELTQVNELIASTETKFLKSLDGGHSWTTFVTGYWMKISKIEILPSQTILIAGSGGMIIQSQDSGETWEMVFEGFGDYPLLDFKFTSNLTGYMLIGENYGIGNLYKSTDGGYSWTKIEIESNHLVREMDFINDQYGMITMENKVLKYTNNGGETWYSSITTFSEHTTYIQMFDLMNAIVVGGDRFVAITSDGGANFEFVYENEHPSWNEQEWSYFVNKDHGWTVGYSGMIQRYDSYLTSTSKNSLPSPEYAFLFPNPAKNKAIVSVSGKLTLTNIAGIRYYSNSVRKNDFINLSHLPSGVYIATIVDGISVKSMKLFIYN